MKKWDLRTTIEESDQEDEWWVNFNTLRFLFRYSDYFENVRSDYCDYFNFKLTYWPQWENTKKSNRNAENAFWDKFSSGNNRKKSFIPWLWPFWSVISGEATRGSNWLPVEDLWLHLALVLGEAPLVVFQNIELRSFIKFAY